jgi:hypothetical protein
VTRRRIAALAQLRRADPGLFVRAVAMQLYPSGARFMPPEGYAQPEWVGDMQSVVRPMLDFLLDPMSQPLD